MLSMMRRHMPNIDTFKGLLSNETIASKILIHLILFFPIIEIHRSLRPIMALLFVLSTVLEILLARVFRNRAEMRGNARRLNNGPSMEFIFACVCSFLPTRLIRQLVLELRPYTRYLWGATMKLLDAVDYAYRKPLCTCSFLKVLDKTIRLDSVNASLSIFGLGFIMGILGIYAKLRKRIIDGQPVSHDAAFQDAETVVHQPRSFPSETKADDGPPDEPNLAGLMTETNGSLAKSGSLVNTTVDESCTNEESEKTLTSDITGGCPSRVVEEKSEVGSTAACTEKFSVFTTNDRQSYMHPYAFAHRVAATAYNMFKRNQHQEASENMPRLLLQGSNCSSAEGGAGLDCTKMGEEDSEIGPSSTAPAAMSSPGEVGFGESAGEKKHHEVPDEDKEARPPVVDEETAIKSIWRNDVDKKAEHDINLDSSDLIRLAEQLETACNVPANIEPDATDGCAVCGREQGHAKANGHMWSTGPSNLHEENNMEKPFSIKLDEYGAVNFLNLEPSPALPSLSPRPEKSEDAFLSLVLPPQSFRHKLEARLERMNLTPPCSDGEAIDEDDSDDEDEELDHLGPTRFVLPIAPPRGEVRETGSAEVDDEVWFSSRTLHRELVCEEPELADISFSA